MKCQLQFKETCSKDFTYYSLPKRKTLSTMSVLEVNNVVKKVIYAINACYNVEGMKNLLYVVQRYESFIRFCIEKKSNKLTNHTCYEIVKSCSARVIKKLMKKCSHKIILSDFYGLSSTKQNLLFKIFQGQKRKIFENKIR